MSRTKVLTADSHHIALRLVTVAVFALLAFGLTSLTANAMAGSVGGSNTSSGGGHSSNKNKPGGTEGHGHSAFGQKDLDNIMDRIADLEAKKGGLLKKLGDRQGKASSTASSTKDKEDKDNSGPGNWKDRFCKDGAGSSLSSDLRERMCDRWKPATSTPDTRPNCPRPLNSDGGSRGGNKCERASTTPMIKLQHPNAGTAYKHPIDGAVIIKWRNTTSDKTVDIDLKKGSTTTSIAKNVTGKRINSEGDVLGMSTVGVSIGGDGDRVGNPYSDGNGIGTKNGAGERSDKNKSQLSGYRWKDAPVGEGYKIVLTVKVGETTYTDESDKVFSVKKNPRGMNWYDTDAATNGDVLGASTTAEMQVDEVLNYLADTLAEMTVALSSQ